MESNSKSELRNKLIKDIEKARHLTFAEKRLIKDLEELEEQVDPQLGVAALPLEGNLFKWHANIKGPDGTPYENSILHFEIEFPKEYPN